LAFNLRVYGLVRSAAGAILLSEERRAGFEFCKFPGGGVQAGEGILDALHREFKEELDAEIIKAEFFYFNEFYQPSRFNPNEQVICFYYLATLRDPERLTLMVNNLPIGGEDGDYERFRWISLDQINENILTFPIDRKVLSKFKKMLI